VPKDRKPARQVRVWLLTEFPSSSASGRSSVVVGTDWGDSWYGRIIGIMFIGGKALRVAAQDCLIVPGSVLLSYSTRDTCRPVTVELRLGVVVTQEQEYL